MSAVPLSDQELQVAKGRILHLLTIVGGDAIIYNLPEVESKGLRLTAPILADVYRGKITEWDEPLIRDANPRVPIPRRHVIPIYLSDVSGSTTIFNDYLSKAVSSWRSRALPLAPVSRLACSISASDAQAVARVKQTPGGIGYADISFAFDRVSVANILNRSGQTVEPDSETLHAAAVNSSTQIPQDLRMSITRRRRP